MPPAVGAAAVTGGAILGSGLIGFAGAKSAQKSQQQASDQAIQLAREQEAERKREWDAQQQAAAYQWKVMQANLAPYRAARAAVLGKYGINTNVEEPPMPANFGMPGSAAPVPPLTPSRGGGGLGALAGLGMGLGAGSAALQAYLGSKQSPYQTVPGPYTSNEVGGPGGPPGPPAPPIDLSNLENWADWQQAIGNVAGG